MSIQHVAAVLYHMPELEARGSAFALLAIADSADRVSGWSYYISMASIASAARLSERGARMALRALEAGGYVRSESTPGRTPRYRVLFNFEGIRRSEVELYTPPARTAPPRKNTPATVAPTPAASAPAPAASAPHNNEDPSSIRDSSGRAAKSLLRKISKNAETPAAEREASKQRQLSKIRERMSSSVTP